jgi:hypothetical protein
MTLLHWHWRLNWVIVRMNLRNSTLLQTPVANHGVVYRSNLFKNCIGYTMFRHKSGQEDLISLVGCHVPGEEVHQFVLDALSRLCDNHMPAS